MQDSLELLLADIYALDPKLRERDTEVRAMVSELLANKPTVKINENFAQNLRAKLLTPQAVPALRPQAIPSPWLRYFVPLGAVAVLLLMLVPNYVGQPTVYDNVAPSVAPVGAPDAFVAPEAKRSMDQSQESVPMMMLMEEGGGAAVDGNDLGISFQTPGVVALVDFVSLTEPGFVVISRSENGQTGAVLGFSYLLFAGYNEQIEIPLSEPMKAGETFVATLYLDNGDGIFDINSDTPLYDLDGVSLLSHEFFSAP